MLDRRAVAMTRLDAIGTTADPEIGSVPKPWRVRLATGLSLATLQAVAAKVITVQPWARDAGDNLIEWYVDPRIQKVVIGLERITPILRADAREAFGNLAVLTVAQPATPMDRLIDYQPYYGSDRVISGGLTCTAGFEVTTGAHNGMLTAGHCWGLGTIAQQGYYDSGGHPHTSGNMGKVTARSYGDYLPDVELLDSTAVGTSVSPLIWTGPQTNPRAYAVHGQGSSFIGASVCFDGSVSSENCSAIVDNLDVCLRYYQGPYVCHLDRTYSFNGSQLTQLGDSGGPIESSDGHGGLLVYGTIAASGGGYFYYADIAYELSQAGVSLVTG
jgi:hypothetical protein